MHANYPISVLMPYYFICIDIKYATWLSEKWISNYILLFIKCLGKCVTFIYVDKKTFKTVAYQKKTLHIIVTIS